jgi:hypothetical protein
VNKILLLALSLTAIVTFQVKAESRGGGAGVGGSAHVGGVGVSGGASVGTGNRYNGGAHSWAEGTVSARGADGRLSIRGSTSPYANDYMSYHNDYYSHPENRSALGERYRDRLHYSWNDNNLNDYSFTVPNYDTTTIYDEPNYGSDYTTWDYNTEPRTYRYNDINVGDRVVIGYDENGNRVNSMYRVNPRNRTEASVNANVNENRNNTTGAAAGSSAGSTNRVEDNTRANNTGTTNNTNDQGTRATAPTTPNTGSAGSTNRAPGGR